MLHEYAVDPTDLGRLGPMWMLMEQFGVSQGRIIAEFPRKWLHQIHEELARSNCPPLERKAIEVRLIRMKQALGRLGGTRDYTGTTWHEAAVVAHKAIPFRAILTEREIATEIGILRPLEATSDNPLWSVNRGQVIPRTAHAIAECAGPLGRISKHLLFIDPYLCGDDDRLPVVIAMLKACAAGQRRLERVELHVSLRAGNLKTFGLQLKSRLVASKIQIRIRIYKWDRRPEGDRMHPRYFLTERGGIRYDYGLAVGQPGQTTDVELLDDAIYAERWKNYQPHTSAFKLAEPVISVE